MPDTDDDSVFEKERQPDENELTVVNRFGGEDDEVFVKRQCMHCIQPACASACLTKAMLKTPEGPVIWRESKCMGCRFCMVSCPFDIPKFEYHSANPRIRKCVQCSTRIAEGKQPACVDACPNEALMFGPRHELVKEGWRRILESPDEYHGHIYGEHEVGGTGTMYLSSVPFEKLGFRTDLGKVAYPEFTTGFLYSVPIILTLWPAFLLGLSNATKRVKGEEEIEVSDG
jgi:Fe-S-cluster-containing dehydrogenase component